MTRRSQDLVATRAHSLTREAVVTAALDLIDQDGLQAVTMRALAGGLGVRAQSLYTHVVSREDLFDALADRIVHEIDGDPGMRHVYDESWQHSLADTARAVRRYARRHPDAFVLLATRPAQRDRPQPPLLSQRWIDTIVANLSQSGFDDDGATFACRVFDAFLLGSLLLEIRDLTAGPDPAQNGTTRRLIAGPSHHHDDDFTSALDNVIHRIATRAAPRPGTEH